MLFRISQKIKLFLYNSKSAILNIIKFSNLIIALSAIGLFLYYYGYPHSLEEGTYLLTINRIIFTYFIIQFIIQALWSDNFFDYYKQHWFEGLLISLIAIEGILFLNNLSIIRTIFNFLGYHDRSDTYQFFIEFYLLSIAIISFLKSPITISSLYIKSSLSLILSLLFLSLFGGFLLTMPEMTISGQMTFSDAIFTSVSAISQTGLIIVDTGSYFTTKGHIIIMLLIQIGALGIISFGTFFSSYISKGLSVKRQHTFQDFFFSEESEVNTTKLFQNIMYYTILIDLLGAVFIYFSWNGNVEFDSLGDKIFSSIFYSISAFCNAGFSLHNQGLYTEGLRNLYATHIIVIILVFLGSVGYTSLFEIFNIKQYIHRRKKHFSGWKLNTQISIYTSLILVFGGAFIYFLLEYNNTLKEMDFLGSSVASVFQSTMRTAGFNTVDISQVSTAMLIVFCFLMFIGGSSASVCGGIKTSTFALTMIAIYNFLSGRNKINLAKKEIAFETIKKILAIWIFSLGFVFSCIFLLTITEDHLSFMDIVFEQISAFGTVGLSTGITSQLSEPGRWIIMLSMFVGRVGTVTVAFAVSSQIKAVDYKYPTVELSLV